MLGFVTVTGERLPPISGFLRDKFTLKKLASKRKDEINTHRQKERKKSSVPLSSTMLYVRIVSWNQGTTQGGMEPSLNWADSERCAILTVACRVLAPFVRQNLINSVCLVYMQMAVFRRTLLVYVLSVLVLPGLLDSISDKINNWEKHGKVITYVVMHFTFFLLILNVFHS
jgi:hypothetical protein